MVVANASNARVVSDALAERLDGYRAVLDDRSLATGLVAVQGPRALEILGPLTDIDLAGIRYYGIAEGTVAGMHALVARTGYTGEDGFEVFVEVERAAELWDAMLEAGRPHGLVPVGLGARDTLRLEAGMPLYGNELDRATNPFEASLGRVVKLAKPGDFTGRAALEAVARDGVGPPPGRAWSCGSAGSPATGTRCSTPTARPASSPRAPCRPRSGRPIAMAYVAPGTCRTRYDAGRRDPWCPRRRRGRAAPVLQAACLTPGGPGRPDRHAATNTRHPAAAAADRETATEEPARWSPATCATPRSTSGSASRVTRP